MCFSTVPLLSIKARKVDRKFILEIRIITTEIVPVTRMSLGLLLIRKVRNMASSLGDRIRLVRKTNRLNQVEFSNMIGISQGTLSELEQDKFNPSLETILSIHKVFHTNLTWLLLGETEQADNNKELDLFQSKLNEKEILLINLFERLEDHDKEEILQFMDLKLIRYKNK